MKRNRKIYGFWHIASIGQWESIVRTQLARIIDSGLYAASEKIFVNVLGMETLAAVPDSLKSDKFSVSWDHDVTHFEFPTLKILHQKSFHEDFSCWYIHSKGASSASGESEFPVWCWREYMEYFVLQNWRICLDCLADHDTVGVEFLTAPRRHYSGNFWWANASYIRQLPSIDEVVVASRGDRFMAEFWIGLGDPRAKSLHNFNRSLYLVPVKREAFSDYADPQLFIAEERTKAPAREKILRYVNQAGSDSLAVFGGMYEGGYNLQQVPEEFADLIHRLQATGRRFANYLEIGAAAGGTARLLDDFFAFDALHVIDDNRHPRTVLRQRNLPRAVEYIGDSHGSPCRVALNGWDKRFDLVLVDGDHEYDGVKQDTELALSYANNGCFVVFHDSLSMYGVGRWTKELIEGRIPGLQHRFSIGRKLGLEVFEFVQARAPAATSPDRGFGSAVASRGGRESAIRRVAVVFDDTVRSDTTGVYCRRAMETILTSQHFLPSQLADVSPSDFDLFLYIDDGLRYEIPDRLRPCAWWAIDTHLDFPWYRANSAKFDHVFTAQRDGALQLRNDGIAAEWLPLACDPEIHRRRPVPKEFQICFVGAPHAGERSRLLDLIQRQSLRTFIGQRYFAEMARTYSASCIVFNRSIRNDINMRVFEALACGSMLLTNDLTNNGQDELFRDAIHLATYANDQEMFDKIGFYLTHDDVRERIAETGRQEAVSKHTYQHRMETILERLSRLVVDRPTRSAPGRISEVAARGTAAPLLTAGPPASSGAIEHALTSIVILTYDQFSFTRQCVESVLRWTEVPFELIFVDNGSTDGTLEYLRTVPNATLIENPKNRGVPAGFNQGIRVSRGSNILLLNNDVIVTQGWLGRLLGALSRDERIGLVGPCLTWPDCAQSIPISYTEVNGLMDFARNWAEAHRGEIKYIPPDLIGACLLIRREVIAKIGLFDEDFGIGQCEDNDYCRRAVEAGFQCVIAREAFVHHHGHRTFLGNKIDGAALLRSNLQLLQTKTEERVAPVQLATSKSSAESPSDGGVSATGSTDPKRATPGLESDDGEALLDEIPKDAMSILCIGRDAQTMVASLRRREGASVKGIVPAEMNPICGVADTKHVVVRDLSHESALDFGEEVLDCIVLEGVLDVVPRPDHFLCRLRSQLTGNGCLIAKIPNSQSCRVVSSLLRGTWLRGDRRSADGTPNRLTFYTRRDIEQLLYRSGYKIARLRPTCNADHPTPRGSNSGGIRLGKLLVTGLSDAEAEDLYADDFLVCALPAARNVRPPTSIIIPTRNQLPYTKRCLQSIREFTDEAYEIIVVDNGSTDGTLDFLRTQGDVRLIVNSENRGYPAACNQGIGAAIGECIVLLNNDTVATTGWLDRMLTAMESDAKIGLVGPCSNYVSGSQYTPINYDYPAGLEAFAWDWSKSHAGLLDDTDRLIGFCLLIRRSLVQQIGFLDERFGLGNFEDDDYCRRARLAGFRCVIAREAFIHHFGGVTHAGEGIDYRALLARNEALYRAKWARPEEVINSPTTSIQRDGAHGQQAAIREVGSVERPDDILLSLCMIVRDNAKTLDAALSSAKPWVDEIIVVDTGSVDDTPNIAERHGARVYRFPWCDDFSAARNESIRHARGKWIFWMDSDDTIDASCGQKLRALANQAINPKLMAYVMQVHCPGAEEAGLTVVDHVKMFRNALGLRFDGRIHEQILPSIRRAGGEIEWTDVYVRHSGSDTSAEGRKRKHARDMRLLQLEIQERPDHPFTLFNLGMTYADMREHERAANFLSRCIMVAPSSDSHVRKAYALLASCFTELERTEAAWETCEKGLSIFTDDVELLFRQAILAHRIGRLPEAERAYLRALSNTEQRHFSSLDPAIRGFKARHNLAVVYVDMGRWDDAESQWRQVIREAPDFAPGWRGFGEALLRQGKHHSAAAEFDRLLDHPKLRLEPLFLRAKISKTEGRIGECLDLLNRLIDEFPNDIEPLHMLCQLLFEQSDLAAAEKALRLLTERDPTDAPAFHNLGMVLAQLNRNSDAVIAFRKSLVLRPASSATYAYLGRALQSEGQLDEANAALAEAERLAQSPFYMV